MFVLGSRASSDNISAAEQIMLQCRAFFTIAENNFGNWGGMLTLKLAEGA